MGIPEHQRQSNHSGGVFVVLAILAGLGLLLVAAILFFGLASFRTSAPAYVTPQMAKTEVVYEDAIIGYSSDDLVVEIDRDGQTYVHGQPMPLDQIESRMHETMQHMPVSSDEGEIRAVEGTPFEHVEKVIEVYRRVGIENPNLSTIPPRRDVVVEKNAEGQASVDGQPVEDAHNALQEIATRHGARASVTIRAHPQCPAEEVVQLTQACRQLGFGEIDVQGADAAQEQEDAADK